METETVIVIFAKAPVPGAVKTRLIPALGAPGAAMLYTALIERAIQTALMTRLDVVLCCAPDATHNFFANCAEDFDLALAEQSHETNLGSRMLGSLNEALSAWPRVLLIGADCPAMDKRHLLDAAEKLATHDVVLTPADDGGYVLIGARQTRPTMFAGIDWGTEHVLAQQHAALNNAGLTAHNMPRLWDVDRPDDLARLKTLNPPLEFFWPI